MTVFRLKYVQTFEDRHGKRRYYYRCPGSVRIPLPGDPGSKAFMAAYAAAAEGAPKREIRKEAEIPHSLSALIALYYKSSRYKALTNETKRTYRNVLERLRRSHGKLPVIGMKRKHVAVLLDGFADRPGAQYNFRRVLRILLDLAVERGWRDDNPMVGMRRPRSAGVGFVPWTWDEIEQFKAHHPPGTRARLALSLLLYTAQRRGDVVKMGRQHRKDDRIHVATGKSGGRTRLWIPMHHELRSELEYVPASQLTYLVTSHGKPYTAAGFGNWFREQAEAAGLKGRAAHGLRKAALTALAEAGCTAHQIKAISGHSNLAEVQLYTASADQAALAEEAIAKLERRTKSVNPARSG